MASPVVSAHFSVSAAMLPNETLKADCISSAAMAVFTMDPATSARGADTHRDILPPKSCMDLPAFWNLSLKDLT